VNPTESSAQAPSYRAPVERARRILAAPAVGPFLALLLTMAFFSLKSDRFLQGPNLSLVLQQVMVVGSLSHGMPGATPNRRDTLAVTSLKVVMPSCSSSELPDSLRRKRPLPT